MTIELTKTRLQVVNEAGEKLNLVATGQSLDDDYRAKIDNLFGPMADELSTAGICHIADEEAIPSAWFDSLAIYLANKAANIAGNRFDPNIQEYAIRMLRLMNATDPSYERQEAEYF